MCWVWSDLGVYIYIMRKPMGIIQANTSNEQRRDGDGGTIRLRSSYTHQLTNGNI